MSGAARRDSGGEDAVERVRDASEIVEVVGQYVSLRKVGRSWQGLCPFHQEKTPSFHVSPERQTYHCFGCGAGGDVFRFVQEAERVEFPEALRLLAERAGIRLPARRAGRDSSEALFEVGREAAEHYRRCLRDPTLGDRARDFLARRGIEPEVEERFGLGYAPPGWDGLSSRLAGRFGESLLVRSGLAIQREGGRGGVYDRFRDRLVVPLRVSTGRVVGFGGRTLGDELPKYLNSPETPVYRKGKFLFGLGEAREALRERGEAVLVEGYFDVLTLHQKGFPWTVAVAGTALTADQALLLVRFAPRVCVVFDGDPAGASASARALPALLGAGLEVRVGELPAGEDPDSLARRDPEAFADVCRTARSPAAYLCRFAAEGAEGHGRAVREVLELARALEDLARREALLVEADRLLGVGLERLRRAAERMPRPRPAVAPDDGPPAAARAAGRPAGPLAPVERSLLELLMAVPALAAAAVERIPAAWIRHPVARAAWEASRAEPEAGPARWCEAAEAPARTLLSALASDPAAPAAAERALEDHALRLEERVIEEEREALRRELAGGGWADDAAGAARLERLQELATRLRALRNARAGGETAGKE